jgi:hypothetical protein
MKYQDKLTVHHVTKNVKFVLTIILVKNVLITPIELTQVNVSVPMDIMIMVKSFVQNVTLDVYGVPNTPTIVVLQKVVLISELKHQVVFVLKVLILIYILMKLIQNVIHVLNNVIPVLCKPKTV